MHGRQPLVVLVTAPSETVALEIARTLVDERLAACVSVVPGLTSIYQWEGRREETPEALLLIKTRPEGYAALQRRVLELHPYSMPEVLGLPVAEGAPAYVQWVRESVPIEGG
jgi:periplasmic divalent cation tolerance protein